MMLLLLVKFMSILRFIFYSNKKKQHLPSCLRATEKLFRKSSMNLYKLPILIQLEMSAEKTKCHNASRQICVQTVFKVILCKYAIGV